MSKCNHTMSKCNHRARAPIGSASARGARVIKPALCMAVTFAAALSPAGCSSRDDPRGARAAVRGRVTLDGSPVERGTIVFRSAGDGEGVKATGLIEEGMYRIAPEFGPLVGPARVEIHAAMRELEEFDSARQAASGQIPKMSLVDIPARYGRGTELTVEISAGSGNEFDFQLTREANPAR